MAAADAATATNGDGVSGDVDLYEILEVDRKASADEIRVAYRRLALAWHPGKLCAPRASSRWCNKPRPDLRLYTKSSPPPFAQTNTAEQMRKQRGSVSSSLPWLTASSATKRSGTSYIAALTLMQRISPPCLSAILLRSPLVGSTAASSLASPSLVHDRRKYDQGGVSALAATDMEVDMSQVGMAGTAFAAMASKLGLRTHPPSLQGIDRVSMCGIPCYVVEDMHGCRLLQVSRQQSVSRS